MRQLHKSSRTSTRQLNPAHMLDKQVEPDMSEPIHQPKEPSRRARSTRRTTTCSPHQLGVFAASTQRSTIRLRQLHLLFLRVR